MDILKKIAAESDKMLDEAVEKVKAEGASDWNADLIDKVYRPYIHMLEAANVAGMPVDPVADAVASLVANMFHTLAARVTKRNELPEAVALIQEMMKATADQLSVTIDSEWTSGSSESTH